MILNIWVKDNTTGAIHQVGSDVHDKLITFDGKIEYYNLQNGEGTMFGGYSIIEPPDMDEYISVTPEQFMINRRLLHKDFEKMVQEHFDELFDDEDDDD